jgi:uncharacterized heparinase superfamily protein
VARRARVQSLHVAEKEDVFCVKASHDGYERLPGRNIHHRSWQMHNQSLVIKDRITGSFIHSEIRLHLHPDVKLLSEAVDHVALKLLCGQRIDLYFQGLNVSVKNTTWHPYFGIAMQNLCLVGMIIGDEVRTTIKWDDIA